MRLDRFNDLITRALEADPDPAIAQVQTFEQCGFDTVAGLVGRACNRRVEFTTGASIFVNFVGASPPGGDNHTEPERIVEAAGALDPVPVPPIRVENGRIRRSDIEASFAARITNVGSREITEVYVPEDSYSMVSVRFANGAAAHGILMQALRPGQKPTHTGHYDPPDVI